MIISHESWAEERRHLRQQWGDQPAADPIAQITSDYDAMANQIMLGKTLGDYAVATIGLDDDTRLFYSIMTYRHVVETNGHDAFFSGPEGVVWKDALRGLRKIGAAAQARILMGASLRAGGDPSMDLDQRRKQIANLVPKFEDLDRQFSESPLLGAVWRHFYAARFGQVAA